MGHMLRNHHAKDQGTAYYIILWMKNYSFDRTPISDHYMFQNGSIIMDTNEASLWFKYNF